METRAMEAREQLRTLSESSLNTVKFLETIQQMFNEMNKLISEIREKCSMNPTILDDNDTYTLKINVLLLLNNNSAAMHSGSVHSSKCGYNIGISVAMETDEQVNHRYVHVSFMICRGDYDAILYWPFSYPITISLVDLSGGSNHIFHSIQPGSQAEIFNRPLSTANMPYQISRFCSAEKLAETDSNYVRDGNMFVRLHVDFTETDHFPYQSNKL
ncbi:unnamed protein product [Adineta steineri]|uniref:TRAF1-6 MATH domain-containing protein n=1 Tax=Adineta steineri TaxID=433720 RepID=A0A814RKD3_9BILA|nr:unnamed protein product [Adineta steineri]CAF1605426.1 unnamed protein product [Adineta steineri]